MLFSQMGILFGQNVFNGSARCTVSKTASYPMTKLLRGKSTSGQQVETSADDMKTALKAGREQGTSLFLSKHKTADNYQQRM